MGITKGHSFLDFLQESHTQMTNFWRFKKNFFLKILCCIIYLFFKKLNCGKLSVIAKMLPFFHHPRVMGVRPLQCIWIESLGTDLPNKKGASRVGKKMKIQHKSMRSDNTVSSFIWKFFVQRRHISHTWLITATYIIRGVKSHF